MEAAVYQPMLLAALELSAPFGYPEDWATRTLG